MLVRLKPSHFSAITKIVAREIIDSRAVPTLEVDIITD